MSIMCKGQGIMADFFLGATIFFIVWGIAVSNFWGFFDNENSNNKVIEMESIARITLGQLISSKGEPADWENYGLEQVRKIGLSNGSGFIEESKLVAFSNASVDYQELKQKFELGAFDFFFEFYGEDDINAGLEPVGDLIRVTEIRQVPYKGGVGVAKLTVYSFE